MSSFLQQHKPLFGVLALFLLCAAYVSPFHETAYVDDWTYALNVKHLLDHGELSTHDWSAANPVFQIVWGSLFSFIGGYSFGILHLSTLTLFALALISFYFLCLELDFTSSQSGLLTLGLLSSPLVFRLSFTFMTNIPFFSLLVISLFFYVRAIKQKNNVQMLVASLIASAAILTRQFGMAFVPALLAAWLIDKDRFQSIGFYILGMMLPLLCAMWQLYSGLNNPNWGAQYAVMLQKEFFQDKSHLIQEFFWRPSLILHYFTFFLLPFFIPISYVLFRNWKSCQSKIFMTSLILVFMVYMISGLFYSFSSSDYLGLMPIMWIHFKILYRVYAVFPWIQFVLTFVTLMGGVFFLQIIYNRISDILHRQNLQPHRFFLDALSLFLFAQTMIFFKVYDCYLLIYIPFLLVLIGELLKPYFHQFAWIIKSLCLIILFASSIWTRQDLVVDEAIWEASNRVLKNNTTVQEIDTMNWPWSSYHGAFDDFLQNTSPDPFPRAHDYFQYLEEKKNSARFLVTILTKENVDAKYHLIDKVSYTNYLFKQKFIYIYERQ